MIKLSVMYPAGEGVTFDMDYYRDQHMAIVQRTLNPSKIEIDQGADGQPFVAIGHLLWESAEDMQAGMMHPDAGEATADVPNFTNATPQMQMSTTVQ